MSDEAATGDPDDEVITTADVDWMNRTMIAQSATTVRRAGMALVVVGAAGLLLALWSHWSYQDDLASVGVGSLDPFGDPAERDVSWTDRLDLFARLYGLEVPVTAVGLGFGLRLFADYVVVRTGGSLGPVDVGDAVPPPGPDDEDGEDGEDGPEPVLPPNPSDYEPRG